MSRIVMFFLSVAFACSAATATAQSGPTTNTLEKIRQSGTITMGYVSGSAPFSSRTAGAEPRGYSIALCREIASSIRGQLKLEKLDIRWIELTLQDRLAAVRSGRVDIECSTTTNTLSRQAEVDFSLLTFVDGGGVLLRVDSELRRLADFSGRRIAVISATTTEAVLRKTLAQRGISATIETVADREAGIRLLEQRKVDGFASDRIVLIGAVFAGGKPRGAFQLLDEDFSVEPYAFALPRNDADFRLAVNRALAGLYRGGGIDKIYTEWFGALGPPSLLLSAAYFLQGLAE